MSKNENIENIENIENKAEANKEPVGEKFVAEAAEESRCTDQIETLQAELDEAKRKYAYLAAELDNSRKRFEREKENILKYGSEKILKEMLEVADNFERTLLAINSDQDEKVQNIVVGIEMVKGQFLNGLKKFGLEEVEALGKDFDPNFHEAVAQESLDDFKNDEVTKEYQKGYLLNGRLLRPSKVVVNKAKN